VGLFAARSLRRGEEILHEEPLFTVASPSTLPAALADLDPDERRGFYSLANAYSEDSRNSREEGIFLTNAFSLSPQTRLTSAISSSALYAIFPITARINHSCLPNVKTSYCPSSRSMRVHVLRDVAADEELFTSYLGRAELYGSDGPSRRARLEKSWAFACTCALCSSTMQEASDFRRRELAQIRSSLPGLRPLDVERTLRDCARALDLLEEEGLHLDGDDFALAAARACAWHRDFAAAALWAQVGWTSSKDEYGKESELALALEAAVKRPQGLLPPSMGVKGERKELEELTRELLGHRCVFPPLFSRVCCSPHCFYLQTSPAASPFQFLQQVNCHL
jgi:hypothetical protein